ncbi:hypothetical protein BO70DRAFT_396321 [Aspergillus heteromorphus CBS 117.55]|uniref:Uncharacterized protein n=1 Tax=Aspergillus heteromorphus CBS 117.55 TaxID=1448321 RepID=A0A317W7H1_9EURO|nr:uncharacterized protein BO70DRAFT_396321 [Aspergillus heteromorphus CBS 117.55]PWY82029.1 hypothetical protein BO70DRAFT_396321 [Aspergillus heteromorphus CBS 117.55]
MNSAQKRAVVYSRVPSLRTNPPWATRYPSLHLARLHRSQIEEWQSFYGDVRQATTNAIGAPPATAAQAAGPMEYYMTGNELGVTGRFGEHVLSRLGPVIESPVPRVVIGDVHCAENAHPILHDLPDCVVLNIRQGHTTVGSVIELKTPWTIDLSNRRTYKFYRVLGQLAQYMDTYSCRYGLVSTYNQSIVVRRVSNYRFALSPVVTHRQESSQVPVRVSLKECVLFLSLKVKGNDWRWGGPVIGRPLINGTYTG